MSTRAYTEQETKAARIVNALRQVSIMRAKDIVALGVSREYLRRLHQRGTIQRVGRGLYRLPEAKVPTQHTMLEAAKRVPHGVVCLLSALRFHEVTTQAPFEVWMAVDVKARQPRIEECRYE